MLILNVSILALIFITINKVAVIAKALYSGNSFYIVWYTFKGENAEDCMYIHLTAALFFGNNEKKHLTPSCKCRVTDCYLKYNKVLYKLFKILVIEFTIKYSTSFKNTNISPESTNTSFINL